MLVAALDRLFSGIAAIFVAMMTAALVLTVGAMLAAILVWCVAAELWERGFVMRLILRLVCFSCAFLLMIGGMVEGTIVPHGSGLFTPTLWGMLALFCIGLLLGWNDPREPRVDDKGNVS